MRQLIQRYLHWRGSSYFRHASFGIAAALTLFSLVVLPAQWVPVLFRDDLTVIGLSLVILGIGSIPVSASLSRLTSSGAGAWIVPCAAVGLILVVFAVTLYKTMFRGVGWPEAHELGLGLAFICGCALVGGATGALTRSWPRVVRSIPTVMVALLVGSGGVWLFSHFLPRKLEARYSASQQVCNVRNGITYCANPGYEPFVDNWQPVVEAVLEAAPIDVDRTEIFVAQLLDDAGTRIENSSAAPGPDWGRGSGESIAQLGLGLDMANWLTGIETSEVKFDPEEPEESCVPGTNARSVVAYWLAGQTNSEVEHVIGELGCCADAINGSTFAAPAVGGGWDVAEELLALSRLDVAPRIEQHWDELVDPKTPVSRVVKLFDLDVTEITEEEDDQQFATCASRYD